MRVEDINVALRELFQSLVNDGYKKRHICSLTLGAQSEPQFESFLKGNDFGFRPLQRIIDNLSYKFHIIITPRDTDEEIEKFVADVNQYFLSDCKELLLERLNDQDTVKSATTSKKGVIVDVSNEIFEAIVKK